MPSTSYRLPESLNARLEAAASERGTYRSELTRRAVRFYISENPDGIRVFKPKSARGGGGAPADQEAGQEGGEGDEPDLDQSRGRGGAPTDQGAGQEGVVGDEPELDEVQGFLGGVPYNPMEEF